MRFQYVVTLKKTNEKYIDRISLCLCSFSVAVLIGEQVRTARLSLVLCAEALVLLVGIGVNLVAASRKKRVRYRNWLFLAGLFWIMMPYLKWFALLYFGLEFLEYQAKRPLEIGFGDDQVQINSLPKKTYGWADFNNVVLKDGLLTLDFRNNKLIQKETQEEDQDDADEEEFNTYCHQQLLRAVSSN
jgi:hypothetical protein